VVLTLVTKGGSNGFEGTRLVSPHSGDRDRYVRYISVSAHDGSRPFQLDVVEPVRHVPGGGGRGLLLNLDVEGPLSVDVDIDGDDDRGGRGLLLDPDVGGRESLGSRCDRRVESLDVGLDVRLDVRLVRRVVRLAVRLATRSNTSEGSIVSQSDLERSFGRVQNRRSLLGL